MSNKSIPERATYAAEHIFNNEDSKYRPILIGGVLTVLIPLIIPLFILFGFQLKVYKSALEGDERPTFGNILDLLTYGIRSFLVLLPAFILLGIIGSIPNILRVIGVLDSSSVLYLIIVPASVIITTYLSPIFLLQYIDTDTIGGTYDIPRAFSTFLSIEYLIGYTAFFIIASIVQIIALFGMVFIITIPFISIIVTMFSAAYLGDFFRQFSKGPDVEDQFSN